MNDQQTIRDLVVKLGGAKHVAWKLGIRMGNVSAWSMRGSIPWKWRATVKILADKAGLKLTRNQKQLLSLQPDRAAA